MDKTLDSDLYFRRARSFLKIIGPCGITQAFYTRCHKLMTSRAAAAEIYEIGGNASLKSREYSKSANKLRKAAILDPNRPQLWQNLGLALLELGKDEEGLMCFKTALNLSPSNSNIHVALIKSLERRGLLGELERIYSEATEEMASTINIFNLYMIGTEVLTDLRMFAQAVEFFEKLIEIFPENAHSYHRYADVLKKAGRWEETNAACGKATELERAGIKE